MPVQPAFSALTSTPLMSNTPKLQHPNRHQLDSVTNPSTSSSFTQQSHEEEHKYTLSNRPSRRHRITIAPTVTQEKRQPSVSTISNSSSSVSSTATTESRPTSSNSTSRMRASSPTSKSRYISHLKEALKTQCAHSTDKFWSVMQDEARAAAENEPLLASFLFASILNHKTLYSALAFHLANKLASTTMPSTILMKLFEQTMSTSSNYCYLVRQDLIAVMERDPACTKFIDAMLYFKGFHALQVHRISHILWCQNRFPLAYHLQSQVSKELQVDIHPAAILGSGIFIDHATGIVVGETASIGDNCSILHHVTLGGSGKKHGDRHPKLGDGVLVGTGATLLGNIHVGDGAQIGACSLVLEDIPAHSTAVGVPAKVLKGKGVAVPALEMKHERCLAGCADESNASLNRSSEKSQAVNNPNAAADAAADAI